jgi:hypothetical protein
VQPQSRDRLGARGQPRRDGLVASGNPALPVAGIRRDRLSAVVLLEQCGRVAARPVEINSVTVAARPTARRRTGVSGRAGRRGHRIRTSGQPTMNRPSTVDCPQWTAHSAARWLDDRRGDGPPGQPAAGLGAGRDDRRPACRDDGGGTASALRRDATR